MELGGVQGTSDDAAVSKLSACLLGYYEDDFMRIFVGKETRRSPLINRGYFARVAAMDMIIERFMEATASGQRQIVVLGAGSDTTYFRLRKRGFLPDLYVEMDLEGVVAKKLDVIRHYEHVQEALGVTAGDVDAALASPPSARLLRSKNYVLTCADVRQPELFETVLSSLEGFDFSAPTLFISECVLCYVEPRDSEQFLRWALGKFPHAAFTSYEQILPDDAFGRTMLGHFESRGCPLLAIKSFPDIQAQTRRFETMGWPQVEVFDMNDVYYKCIPRSQVRHAERIEIFDEFEEWHMMQAHYCVILTSRSQDNRLEGLRLLKPEVQKESQDQIKIKSTGSGDQQPDGENKPTSADLVAPLEGATRPIPFPMPATSTSSDAPANPPMIPSAAPSSPQENSASSE
ncbi:Leucine carboxyl methyltransferase 1 [Hondaea fermentalgiana]|uniref:[phosphatase 2A protein]-leucine-carboxy methyltransferase n=1 Tax=Hondaea fermentalgiana TaxID=2315210 RepID=A0A2R5G0L9_9STRA|nr:Leucine carboxyl methyltransferase 1 [Hondaea fermentalgiana]|eukprot:GBG24562.1 Leucine carboxyl methyltransferase 1 [Hondaea fermentalgiana]